MSRTADVILSENRSGVLPTSSLCIEPAKAVWVLFIDAICINYDGNVLDATLLAMIAALKNSERVPRYANPFVHIPEAQLPKATFNEETGSTICSRKQKQHLDMKRTPVSTSFGIFDS